VEFGQSLDYVVRYWSIEPENRPFAGILAHGSNMHLNGRHIFGKSVKGGLVTEADAAIGMLYGLDVV
jgi:hypothetical protein